MFQTRLSKILSIKKDWITQLKDMNTEAEKKASILVSSELLVYNNLIYHMTSLFSSG